LNKWDFLMVFQAAGKPIQELCKSPIRLPAKGSKNPAWRPGGRSRDGRHRPPVPAWMREAQRFD
jgi:hypothetical protein